MSSSIRWIVLLCLTSFLWSLGFGTSAPLASLWLQDAGIQDTFIGLNTGIYYLGIVVAAFFVPRLLERWGCQCLLVGMAASGLTVLVFPWGGSLAGWFALRALNGVAAALSLVPLETYVNRESADDQRAKVFGCYAFSVALGMALGTMLGMGLYPYFPVTAFVLGGAGPLLGTLTIIVWRPSFPAPPAVEPEDISVSMVSNLPSYGSTWSQGFLEGGMVGLLPLYLLSVGFSESTASWLMSGVMMGAIVAQLPVAWLADRFGRLQLLITCHVLALLGLLGLLMSAGTLWLAICLFVVGACSGAFYPLGLALLGDRIPAACLARANARYLAVNSLGSLIGPAIAGAAMDGLGRMALFLTGAGAVGLVFAAWLAQELRFQRQRLRIVAAFGRDEDQSRLAA
jgi:MFS family permease